MKTDDLLDLLAAETPAVDRRVPSRRVALIVLLGFAAAVVMTAVGLGLRADLGAIVTSPMFWARIAYPAVIGAGALWLVLRLSRPGVPIGARWSVVAAPVAVALVSVALVLARSSADDRVALVMGHTWRVCPALIALISAPMFVAMLWAVRQMAPVRPRVTGAAVGLLAGATAAVAYCLHCPEMALPFWAIWYLLGMTIPAAIGALLGPRVLRW